MLVSDEQHANMIDRKRRKTHGHRHIYTAEGKAGDRFCVRCNKPKVDREIQKNHPMPEFNTRS